MASNEAGQGGQTLVTIFRFLKIGTLNSWRRLLIGGHYLVICFHQQRLRRAWRVLGQRVHRALESGEVNPMLTGEVKDSLSKAQGIDAAKSRHYQAIAALRQKIRASRTGETPSPEEGQPAPAGESEPPPVRETGSAGAQESSGEQPQG